MSERVGRVRDWRRALPGKWSRQRMMEWKQRNRIPELPPGLEPGHPFLPFLCRAGRGYRGGAVCLAGAEAAERGRGRPTDPYFCLGPDSGVIICADPPRSLPPSALLGHCCAAPRVPRSLGHPLFHGDWPWAPIVLRGGREPAGPLSWDPAGCRTPCETPCERPPGRTQMAGLGRGQQRDSVPAMPLLRVLLLHVDRHFYKFV